MVKLQKYLMEFIGTFFLVFTLVSTLSPVAIGLMLMVMVYMGMHISGAHYNPAITGAVWLRGRFDKIEMLYFWGSQILGAFLGAWFFKIVSDSVIYPLPARGVNMVQAILVETLGAFVWCAIYLTVTASKKFKANGIYGIAIGVALASIAFMGGAISGGAFNPAVGIGTILLDVFVNGVSSLKYLTIYLVGPFAGGVLAVYAFNYLES